MDGILVKGMSVKWKILKILEVIIYFVLIYKQKLFDDLLGKT